MRTPTISTQLSVSCFRTLRRSSVLVAGALLAACNDPPRVCDGIPEQELFTGEDVLLKPCFEDPEGEALTLAATSSEDPVAIALVYGLEVGIHAISPGKATVDVTATDPGGRSASLDIGVLVPNRPPHADGELSDIGVLANDTTELPIGLGFADPDGEPLSFTATSGDPSVASASIQDSSTLVVRGLAHGATTVTLTATDPGELTGERTIDVGVLEPVLIFRDDFDSSNRAWIYSFSMRFFYRDGLLHMRNRTDRHQATVGRTVNVTDWEYRASVGVEEDAECYWVGLVSTHEAYDAHSLTLFTEGSYRVAGPSGRVRVDERGSSDAVRVVGERTEMVWTSRWGVMTLAAGETVLARLDHELFAPSSPEIMRSAWLYAYFCDDTDSNALYDWADLWAVEAAGGS